MTAIATPRAGGSNRRARIAAIIVLFICGASLLVWSSTTAKGDDDNSEETTAVSCEDLQEAWETKLTAVQALDREDFTSGDVGAAEYNAEKATLEAETTKAQREVERCKTEEDDPDDGSDPTPTTAVSDDPPPGGDADDCKVDYRSYDVKGVVPGAVVRFGNQPVEITGTGDANKVLDVLDKQISTEAFKAAVLTQGNYIIDGGISVDEVQATATRFQQNPEQWRDSNRVVREKLNRAQSVTLEQTNRAYNTQDAVLGANRCVAPAVQNTTSSGQKWILVIHLSQQDGGRTVRLVVNCDFQIQEFGAPPASPPPAAPTPAPPRGTPPTTAPPVVTTAPPVTQPPTTAPPVTQPPTTVPPTVPPTVPNKTCTEDPMQFHCTGTPQR
jgi:hypothetical protein